MSVEAMAVVLHHSRAKGTDKLVLLGIANHAGDGGSWPYVETLARYANVSERAVQASLTKLVQLGELARHTQRGGTLDSHAGRDHKRPNRYDVLLACPAWCDRTVNHRPRRGWHDNHDGSWSPDAPAVLFDSRPSDLELERQQLQLDSASLDAGLAEQSQLDADVPAVPLWPEDQAPRTVTPATPPPPGWRRQVRQAMAGQPARELEDSQP